VSAHGECQLLGNGQSQSCAASIAIALRFQSNLGREKLALDWIHHQTDDSRRSKTKSNKLALIRFVRRELNAGCANTGRKKTSSSLPSGIVMVVYNGVAINMIGTR
jgi:hypothetical protein